MADYISHGPAFTGGRLTKARLMRKKPNRVAVHQKKERLVIDVVSHPFR